MAVFDGISVYLLSAYYLTNLKYFVINEIPVKFAHENFNSLYDHDC